MKRSEIVLALAELASQGTYQVKPPVARQMNAIFDAAANLVNELEAEEMGEQGIVDPEAFGDNNDDS
jgi:hypothetical protein